MASQFSLNSAIKYLQYSPWAWGLRGACGGTFVIFSCRFTVAMYHTATASVFLLTHDLYAFVVF